MSCPSDRSDPHFMPAQAGRPPKDATASALPKRCQFVHGNEIKLWTVGGNSAGTLGYSHCKQCYRPFKPETPDSPEEPLWRKQTMYGCAGCKVNICSWLCFKAWDHKNQCSRRELVVQYAQVQPDSVESLGQLQ